MANSRPCPADGVNDNSAYTYGPASQLQLQPAFDSRRVFPADLPAFAASLLISCIAVACRPLRFRSRITSIALCMLPQLLYWGIFGGAKNVEPIKWGFSFTPWIGAWLIGFGVAGAVLAIGHFSRTDRG